MARIKSFFEVKANSKLHPTEVDCGWTRMRVGGKPILQLNTYGSDTRQSEPKVSQTIQIDEAAARDLLLVMLEAFPTLRSA